MTIRGAVSSVHRNALLAATGTSVGKVHLSRKGHVAYLTLDNPSHRNAMTGPMMIQLSSHIDSLASNVEYTSQCTHIVLHSSNDISFCAGADLSVKPTWPAEAMTDVMTSSLTRLRSLPYVSWSWITGPALGGGAELLTATDFRLMSSRTNNNYIQFVQALRGVTTGWGGTSRLVKLIGERQALSVLGTSRVIDAHEALRIGLVDGVTSSSTMEEYGMEMINSFTSDKDALRGLKKVLTSNVDDHEVEKNVFLSLWGGPSNKAALLAREKNKT